MAERDQPELIPSTPVGENLRQIVLEITRGEPGLSIQQMASRVSETARVPMHRVAREIHSLRAEGVILLEDPHPPLSILEYIGSSYGIWFTAALGTILLTLTTVYLLPQAPPFIYLRYLTGSIQVLYLPGAALIEALYPKEEDLEGLERLALSIGLSLAIVPLVGLALNYTPWGIRLNSVLTSLVIITSGLALLAASRKVGYIRLARAAESP